VRWSASLASRSTAHSAFVLLELSPYCRSLDAVLDERQKRLWTLLE